MSSTTTTQKLTPEQKEAVEVFVSSLPHWREYYVDQLPVTVFENNARFFTPAPLKKEFFPREPHWTWNRSNGTIVIDLYQQFRVRLAKFNSRRRKTALQQQPSYKIWSYSVTVLQTNEEFSFIWCTKGKTRSHRDQIAKQEPIPDTSKITSQSEPQRIQQQGQPKPIPSSPGSQAMYSEQHQAQTPQYSLTQSTPQLSRQYSNSYSSAVQLQNQYSNVPQVPTMEIKQSPNCQEDTPTNSSSSSDISLADFAFLREFADPEIACQFGWDA